MSKYKEAEINLAKALVLGWPDAQVIAEDIVCAKAGRLAIPAYYSDQSAVDDLVAEYGGKAVSWKGAAWVGNGDDAHFQHESFEGHSSEAQALRYASVLALTVILQARHSI